MKNPTERRSLITGAAGFIGSHLAGLLLERGEEVYGIDNFTTGSQRNIEPMLSNPRFVFEEGDILEAEPLNRFAGTVHRVYHLAAAVGVRYILEHPFESLEVNVEGTRNVLRAAINYRKRILVASSSEVYGKNRNAPLREDDDRVLGPTQSARWSYASAKALDEFLALAASRATGLEVVVVRLFNVVGPGQTGRYGMVLPRFVTQALRDEPITVYGDGSQTRTFTHVSDVVGAMAGLMDCDDAVGEIVNIGGEEEISIMDLARLVKDTLKSRSEIVTVSYEEAYGEGFDDMPRRVPSVEKVKALIGYQPALSLKDAIVQVADRVQCSGGDDDT